MDVFLVVAALLMITCLQHGKAVPLSAKAKGCAYKGATYKNGQSWEDGCELSCKCLDGNTGYYRCTQNCPKYRDLPPNCRLEPPGPGECCSKAACTLAEAPKKGMKAPMPAMSRCSYGGKAYRQGETWKDGCKYTCTCIDASTSHYKCDPMCNIYSGLPQGCSLQKPPGECCAKPVCASKPVIVSAGLAEPEPSSRSSHNRQAVSRKKENTVRSVELGPDSRKWQNLGKPMKSVPFSVSSTGARPAPEPAISSTWQNNGRPLNSISASAWPETAATKGESRTWFSSKQSQKTWSKSGGKSSGIGQPEPEPMSIPTKWNTNSRPVNTGPAGQGSAWPEQGSKTVKPSAARSNNKHTRNPWPKSSGVGVAEPESSIKWQFNGKPMSSLSSQLGSSVGRPEPEPQTGSVRWQFNGKPLNTGSASPNTGSVKLQYNGKPMNTGSASPNTVGGSWSSGTQSSSSWKQSGSVSVPEPEPGSVKLQYNGKPMNTGAASPQTAGGSWSSGKQSSSSWKQSGSVPEPEPGSVKLQFNGKPMNAGSAWPETSGNSRLRASFVGSNTRKSPFKEHGIRRGCQHSGTVYGQGATWRDGCKHTCTCDDAKTGLIKCSSLCTTWALPPPCRLDPAPPGKCCQVPVCPDYVQLTYPPNYVQH